MHFCKAKVAIGGDQMNVYNANEYDPISWPEVLVLQFVHGDDAVDEIIPFVRINQTSRDERLRLAEKYREDVVALVFGGKQGPSEMEAPDATLVEGVEWKNPISMATEITPANAQQMTEPKAAAGRR
jgi:hypothetical protein